MKLVSLLMLICLLYVACTKEIDMPFPDNESQIVLNGILHPDSTVRIALSKTLPVKSSQATFPVVDNAVLGLYENGELVGHLVYEDSVYTIDYYPKSGYRYTIQAEIPGYPTVSASDIVPHPVEAEACFADEQHHFSSYVWIHPTIQDRPSEVNYYWLDVLVTDYAWYTCDFVPEDTSTYYCLGIDSSRTYIERLFYMHSYSTLPDKFNAFVDNTSGGVTTYEGFIRIDDMAIDGENITLSISSGDPLFQYGEMTHIDDNQSLKLQITSASQHYDRYLKSSMIYFLNHGSGDADDNPSPFAEPVQIYSNVENGTGIFAAYNSANIKVDDYPCP